jgi:hypothetical protein
MGSAHRIGHGSGATFVLTALSGTGHAIHHGAGSVTTSTHLSVGTGRAARRGLGALLGYLHWIGSGSTRRHGFGAVSDLTRLVGLGKRVTKLVAIAVANLRGHSARHDEGTIVDVPVIAGSAHPVFIPVSPQGMVGYALPVGTAGALQVGILLPDQREAADVPALGPRIN